jgi:hypothetical protein
VWYLSSTLDRGAIYVATGPGYLDLARASADSLRRTNPGLPVDLFTDDPAAPRLGMFDQVHAVPVIHRRAKLECMALTRFDRTIYLDADTLVVGDLGDVWAVLDRFDLALAHDVRRASELIRQGLTVTTPYAFPQMNSGVMLYRRSPAIAEFLAEWLSLFHASGVTRDQIVLKDLLWRSDLRFYVLPPEYNLRRVTVLDAWEPLDAEVKIIHSHRLLDHLGRNGNQRVADLVTLLRLERQALEGEWAAVGAPDRPTWFTR